MTGCKWCGTTTTWKTETGLVLCVGCNRDATTPLQAFLGELSRHYCQRCRVALAGDNGVCWKCKAKEQA